MLGTAAHPAAPCEVCGARAQHQQVGAAVGDGGAEGYGLEHGCSKRMGGWGETSWVGWRWEQADEGVEWCCRGGVTPPLHIKQAV